MATTDTQQAAQFSAVAAVSAAEAKGYLDAVKQNTEGSSSAAAAAEAAADKASIAAENSAIHQNSSQQNAEAALSFATDAQQASELAITTLSSTVKQSITFTTGGVLNSTLDRISDGTYLYYWTGVYPKDIPAGSTIGDTGGIGVGGWAPDTDVVLRTNLLLEDGVNNIGRGNYEYIRSYSGNADRILCYGVNSIFDGGNGEFEINAQDTTNPDNGCTVLIDALGRRWYRNFEGNIKAAWSGILDTEETSLPQDDKVEGLIKASSVGSVDGYPDKIIDFGKTRRFALSQRHAIRGGVYNSSFVGGGCPDGEKTGFGIIGKFACLTKEAGFLVAQMMRPYFDLAVDNGGIIPTETPGIDDYFFRTEAIVLNPTIILAGNYYQGTVWKQSGSTSMADVRALWPDITQTLPGVQIINFCTIRVNNCGRGFNLAGSGSGFGHVTSIWEQQNAGRSIFNNIADLTMLYENYIPEMTENGTCLTFISCGNMDISLKVGAGGRPAVQIFDCRTTVIKSCLAIAGKNTKSEAIDGQYSIEIAGSVVAFHSFIGGKVGELIRVGYGSILTIHNASVDTVHQFIKVTSNPLYMTYTGAATASNKIVVNILSGRGQGLNPSNTGYSSALPPIQVLEDVVTMRMNIGNMDFEGCGAGWSAESDLYVIKLQTTSQNARLSIDNSRLQDNNTNYPVYLGNANQLAGFRANLFSSSLIRYSDGTSSISNGRDVVVSDPAWGMGTFSYTRLRPAIYTGYVTLSSDTTFRIIKNGIVEFYVYKAGIWSFKINLRQGDSVVIEGNESLVTFSGRAWVLTSE
ncbi:TPA: hypothetical protein RKV49_003279 [Raoultella ornithinolytica]|nr:hypothetical protein [Raoultella ornithinolytica]